METEIEQLNFFDLNVEIAKPFVDVSVVFLFNIFELICRKVDVSVQKGHLELTRIDFKVSIYDWECAPGLDLVLASRLRAEVKQLEDNYIRRDEIYARWKHVVKLVALEIKLRLAGHRIVPLHVRVCLAEVDPDFFGLHALV
jgi:hypothetical protein